MPNARALEEQSAQHYRALGLNQRQIELLGLARPRRDYYYMSPQGNRLFTLALGELARAICAAGSPADLALIDRLSAQALAEPFAAAFLRARGLGWAADLLTNTESNRLSEMMEVQHDVATVSP